MCSNWNELETKGWEWKEVELNGVKKIVFKSPPENGVRRTVSRVRELRKDERMYAKILFPKSKTSVIEHVVSPPNDNIDLITATSNVDQDKIAKERIKIENAATKLLDENNCFQENISQDIPVYLNKLRNLIHTSNNEKKDVEQ